MAHTCSECTYLNLDKEYNSNDGRFWCESRLEWRYANEAECMRYCTAYSRSDSVARSYKEHSEKCQNSGSTCCISTIFEILGLSDEHIYLNVLRTFRKHELQNKEKYRELLVNYDIIGPIIADKLNQLQNKKIIAKNLFELNIKKIVTLIVNGNNLEAIKIYNDMMKSLIEKLNINEKATEEQINNADISQSGHGVYVKKPKAS